MQSMNPPSSDGMSSSAVAVPLAGQPDAIAGVESERRAQADRRRHSPWSLLYGGFRPRRRQGRRVGDEHEGFLDWHEPRVLYLALSILLLSCADALFTLNLLAAGGEEVNGVMRALLGQGPRWFLWSKIGLTGLSIVVLVIGARRLLLGRLPVLWLLRAFFLGYAVLVAWEIYLLGWQVTAVGNDAIDGLARWAAG